MSDNGFRFGLLYLRNRKIERNEYLRKNMALDFIDLFEIQMYKQLTPPIHVLSLGHPTFLQTPETIAPLINNRLLTIDNKRVRKTYRR